MKTSAVTVALVAVASSLATVGAVELLRSSRAGSQPALAIEPPPGSSAPDGAEPLVLATRALDQLTGYEDHLVELERRIAALELGTSARRAPVTAASDEPPPDDDLRDRVLDWVTEEREARRRAEELAEEEKRRKEREFNARFRAHMLAQEHDLASWQEAKLVDVFIAVQERSEEVEKSFDLGTDDPMEVEARWTEFDEWAERYEKEHLGLLYDQIEGDD